MNHNMHVYEVLSRPLLTEKASAIASMEAPQYTFKVAINANKIQIRRAVEIAFGVKVTSVNTVRVKGKWKRLRMRAKGKRPDWKKAIVTLEKGQSINLI